MSNVQFTKFNCFTPIVPNTVDGTLVFETSVIGISTEDDLRQAADMICDGLRRHLIGDEKKAGETADPEGAAPNADNDVNGSADAEANGDEATQEAGVTHCDLSFLEAVAEGREVATDFEFIASMQDFLQDLAEALGVHDEPHISRLPAVADVICHYFCGSTEASDQAPECDGKGNCGGECHCHDKPTAEEETWMEEQYRKAAAGMKPGDSADNVRKWMDEAPDGDRATASGEEDADDQAGRRETAAQRVLPQRQYVHVSLPGGGHISLPEDYVFFGPSRVLENLF